MALDMYMRSRQLVARLCFLAPTVHNASVHYPMYGYFFFFFFFEQVSRHYAAGAAKSTLQGWGLHVARGERGE